jgi:hypothetical protein
MADEDQSIDDQADTATGGLTNDMPGLPMSPPSGPRPPSALGGLASAFQRMMSGAPPPQPIPQGPSPWQSPGQSQLPVQPGPPKPRWTGTTASLFLPRGAPQPPARFTPYMRGPPTTNFRQWGQDDYNQLPQPFEGPGLYQNASKFFGQNGSASIIPLALSMGKNAGAFMNGVMEGREWAAKMHRQKMIDDATELDIKQQQEMTTYFDRALEYTSAKGVGNVSDVGNYAIKGVTLLDALGQDAMKLGDDKFLAVLGTGSVDKAMTFLHARNDNWQTLRAANKSAKKQEDEDNNKEWGVPEDAGGGDATTPRRSQPQADPTQPGGGPAPTVPGGGPAPTIAGGGPAPATPGGKPTTAQEITAPDVPRYKEAGLDNYRDGKSLNDVPKGKPRNYASDFSRRLAAEANRVIARKDAEKLSDEQVQAELNNIVPGMGDDAKRVLTGAPMPTGALGRTPYWQQIATITAPDPIVQSATLKSFAPGGKDAMRLAAGARMGPALKTVLEAAKDLPEGQIIPKYILDQWTGTKWTGDPTYTKLFNGLNTYIQEAQSLNTQTGRFYVTEVEDIKKHLQVTAGPKAIRAVLQQDAELSTRLIDQLRENYHRGSRRTDNPPTYDPKLTDLLRAGVNLNPETGFRDIPQESLPEELRGLGLPNTGGPTTKIPSGWTVTPIQ